MYVWLHTWLSFPTSAAFIVVRWSLQPYSNVPLFKVVEKRRYTYIVCFLNKLWKYLTDVTFTFQNGRPREITKTKTTEIVAFVFVISCLKFLVEQHAEVMSGWSVQCTCTSIKFYFLAAGTTSRMLSQTTSLSTAGQFHRSVSDTKLITMTQSTKMAVTATQ